MRSFDSQNNKRKLAQVIDPLMINTISTVICYMLNIWSHSVDFELRMHGRHNFPDAKYPETGGGGQIRWFPYADSSMLKFAWENAGDTLSINDYNYSGPCEM